MLFNPAATAVDGMSNVNMSYRSQWKGIKGAPETRAISFGMPISSERGAIGFNVTHDAIFIENHSLFFVNFSYKLQLSRFTDLYLGIQGGGNSYRLNGSEVVTYGSNSPDPNTDPLLNDYSKFNPNVGVGIYLKTEKGFVSLSSPKILNTRRFIEEEGYFTTAANRLHFYLMAGRDFRLNETLTLKPYFLTRFVDNAPIFTSINTAINSSNGFEFGLEYIPGSSLGGNMVFDLGNFSFGYAYSRSSHQEINQFTLGSHELLLTINLNSKNPI